MKRSRLLLGCVSPIILCCVVHAQSNDDIRKVEVNGSVEQFFVGSRFLGSPTYRDRFTRVLVQAESGAWKATAAQWYYPFCRWDDLDETNLQYQSGKNTFKIGRFLPSLGQTNWDDQWYSGFVHLPLVESNVYNGRRLLERTSAGIQWEYRNNNDTLTISGIGKTAQSNNVFSNQIKRYTAHWQRFDNRSIYGLSILTDLDRREREEQMIVLDYRYTIPQWIFRGEYVNYSSQTDSSEGGFFDIYHRPKGWTDVTLVGRYESFASQKGRNSYITPGVKIRTPYETTLSINYMSSPNINSTILGGGWALSINKTINF
jgi:hypothetical protein